MATRRRTIARAAGLMAAGAALTLAGASIALAADHAVAISGFSYSPASVTVAVGDTVTWSNSDAQAHTATADDSSWDTGSIANGASGTVTFSAAGTFAYHCAIHPTMTGTVTVSAPADGGGGTATAPPTDTAGAPVSPASSDQGLLPALLVISAAFGIGAAAARRRLATRD